MAISLPYRSSVLRAHSPAIRLLAAVLLFCGIAPGLAAQPIGPSQPITLVHADSTRGYPDPATGENVIDFQGKVAFTQGVVRIEADRATLYEARNYAVLTGSVRVTQPDLVMTAPRAEYDGNTRRMTAPAGVTIVEKGATIRAGAGEYNMYDRRARFRNGVVMQDAEGTLRAASGDYFSLERRAVFNGGVKVETDSGTITARDMVYWRDTRETFATGAVVVTSKQNTARLTGDTLHHWPDRGYTVAHGSPKLVQIDTATTGDSAGTVRRDTTIVTARRMESFRTQGSSQEEYVATDSVKLVRGMLQAVAGRVRFLQSENRITLGPAPDTGRADSGRVDTSKASVDSVGATPGVPGAVAGARERRVGPYPVLWFDKSQLTGDSITVGLEEKKLRWIEVDRNAFAVTEGKRRARYDQLAGSRIFIDVLRDTVRQVRSEENASSVQFVFDEDRPDGVSRASGDTIVIAFDAGPASTVEILGSRTRAEIEYFPEKMVGGQESIYRLEGFRWLGRDGSVTSLDGSMPNAPSIPDPKAAEGTQGRGATPRRTR